MKSVKVDILARDMARLLKVLSEMYGELAGHMRDKIEAMKLADSDRIQSITSREVALAVRITEREGLRRQITRQIVEALGLDKTQHDSITVTELAEHLPEPRRSQLITVAAGLREKLQKIEQMRVVSTLITREMLNHLDKVLSVMRPGGQPTGTYSRTGQRDRAGSASVFEAVG